MMSYPTFDPKRKHLEDQALGFKEDPKHERLLQMSEAEREAVFKQAGAGFRISHGNYVAGREAAKTLGRIA